MCNINAVWKKNTNIKITPLIMQASAHSFIHNSDGEGAYFSSNHQVVKEKNKINYNQYESEIEDSNIVITHQRLSTSGFEVKYNHPFINNNFVLVHNGVINKFKCDEGSDTSGFFDKFTNEFINDKSHISREQKIVKILRNIIRPDDGSFSIIILDRKTNIGYYFKNSMPRINFYTNEDLLFITTASENQLFLDPISDNFAELEIEDNTIYKIAQNGEVMVIGKLKESFFKQRMLFDDESEENPNFEENEEENDSETPSLKKYIEPTNDNRWRKYRT